MNNSSTVSAAELDDWTDRVLRVRGSVRAASTLEELAAALNSPDFAALPLEDLVTLPTFGGERPRGRCVFSWDSGRVLTMNELCDGFRIEPRHP
jgi:hypothetical protein